MRTPPLGRSRAVPRPSIALLLLLASASSVRAQEVPEAPASVELRPARVRFRANLEGLDVLYLPDPTLDDALSVRLGAPSRYQLLCRAPCDRDLPQTHLGLAVRRGAQLVRFDDPLGVDGPTGVRLTWRDRAPEREAGLVILLAGVPFAVGGGLGLSLIGLTEPDGDAYYASGAAVGGALLAGALIAGLVLLLADDDAAFAVTPLPDAPAHLYSPEWR